MAVSADSASPVTAGATSPAVPWPEANRTAAGAVVSVHSRPGARSPRGERVARPSTARPIEADAPAGQPGPQPFPAAVQADLDGPQGPAERLRGLGLGPSLHVAEDDRLPVFLGEPIDLLVQLGEVQGVGPRFRGLVSVDDLGLPPLGGPPPGLLAPGASGHAERDPVQPGAERLGLPDRTGLAGQDEEHRLRRVLRLVRVAEDVEADAMDDRPMPLDEGGEGGLGRLARPGEELAQELLVGPHHDIVRVPGVRTPPGAAVASRAIWLDSSGIGISFYT